MPMYQPARARRCQRRNRHHDRQWPLGPWHLRGLAEFEREFTAERTRADLAAARARGRLGGRPRKMDVSILRMYTCTTAYPDAVAQDLAQRLGITTMTLYMYGNGNGTVKRPARSCSMRPRTHEPGLRDSRRSASRPAPTARRPAAPSCWQAAHVKGVGVASLFGVSHATLYRALAGQFRPCGLRRADRSEPRQLTRLGPPRPQGASRCRRSYMSSMTEAAPPSRNIAASVVAGTSRAAGASCSTP